MVYGSSAVVRYGKEREVLLEPQDLEGVPQRKTRVKNQPLTSSVKFSMVDHSIWQLLWCWARCR